MTKPILVMMSFRGGERLQRCLASIAMSEGHFQRILLSITAKQDSVDMQVALDFQAKHPRVEVLCTGQELPTMAHQAFWVDYLKGSETRATDWIYWLAYDDEVLNQGIEQIVNPDGSWPLQLDTAYFGPWSMRHESPDHLWNGDPSKHFEVWTSFPKGGPNRLPILTWIRQQLHQPTYMQMSGSLIPFRNYLELKHGKPRKLGPMRIEMATALGIHTTHVQELAEPISTIYGRANSDRAAYGKQARKEDVHLLAWISRYSIKHPKALLDLGAILGQAFATQIRIHIGRTSAPVEEWRERL